MEREHRLYREEMGGGRADWESGADKMPFQGFLHGASSFLSASIVGTRGG